MSKDAFRVSKYKIWTILKKKQKNFFFNFLASKVDFGAFSSANFAYFWGFQAQKDVLGPISASFYYFFMGPKYVGDIYLA